MNRVSFRYQVDWRLCKDTPNAYSLFLYPKDGSSYIKHQSNNINDCLLLKEGYYDAILINNTTDGFASISFSGIDHYRSFAALLDKAKKGKFKNHTIYSIPQELSVVAVSGLKVKADGKVYKFAPSPVLKEVVLETYINGIENLSKKGTMVEVGPVPKGIYLSSGEAIDEQVYHLIPLNASPMTMNNLMKQSFSTFGIESAVNLVFHFCMSNRKYLSSIKRKEALRKDDSKHFLIKIGDKSTNRITVPKIDDVDPSSGFEVDVDDWGDDIDLNLE